MGYSMVEFEGDSKELGDSKRAELLAKLSFSDKTGRFLRVQQPGCPAPVRVCLEKPNPTLFELSADFGEVKPGVGLSVYAEIDASGRVVDYAEMDYEYPSKIWKAEGKREIVPSAPEDLQQAARARVATLLEGLLKFSKELPGQNQGFGRA